MNFRSVADLDQAIRAKLHEVSRSVDVVVGIPRSGMLPASIIALSRNIALTDVSSFFGRRVLDAPAYREAPRYSPVDPNSWEHALIVDDSVLTGRTFSDIRRSMEGQSPRIEITYLAVYGTKSSKKDVDLILEECPTPRVFEWNLMHNQHLRNACVDIDGVLCADPSIDENDDSSRYIHFLNNSVPKLIPSVRIGTLVSSRLEKYRSHTEQWLRRNGVEYDELRLLDLQSAVERRRLGVHASFKAEVYKEKRDAWLFIESDSNQAEEIARLSGKSAVATDAMVLFGEGAKARVQRVVRTFPSRAMHGVRRRATNLLFGRPLARKP